MTSVELLSSRGTDESPENLVSNPLKKGPNSDDVIVDSLIPLNPRRIHQESYREPFLN